MNMHICSTTFALDLEVVKAVTMEEYLKLKKYIFPNSILLVI